MRTIITLMFCIALLSCNNQTDPAIESSITAKSNQIKATEDMLGQVPGDNPIFLAIKSGKKYSVSEADGLYRECILKAKDTDYYLNLKHLGFKLVADSGLDENGTDSQKKFYLNEQIALERNFPAFENFFSLVLSCEFLTNQQKEKIGQDFYEKNLKEIDNVTWPDEANKKNKTIKLKRSYTLFQRHF